MSAELIIIALTLIHIVIYVRWKKVSYRALYVESAAFFVIGLLSYAYFSWKGALFDENGVFTRIQAYFPLQPIDLIFMGLSLLLSTFLIHFLTRFFALNGNGLLAVTPWTITCQYRFLHELLWTFAYWVTIDVKTGFRDIVEWIFNSKIPPALLTHAYALLFILFSIFNFFVMLHAYAEKR
jgi:hypothetical protein